MILSHNMTFRFLIIRLHGSNGQCCGKKDSLLLMLFLRPRLMISQGAIAKLDELALSSKEPVTNSSAGVSISISIY